MPSRSSAAPAPGRPLDHPEPDEIRLEAVLHACSDPMRLRIVQALASDIAPSCADIGLACSKSTATHHFRVLREAGVITQRYQGTAKVSALRRTDLDALFPGLLEALLASATAQSARTTGA